jgi:hypothetical protein
LISPLSTYLFSAENIKLTIITEMHAIKKPTAKSLSLHKLVSIGTPIAKITIATRNITTVTGLLKTIYFFLIAKLKYQTGNMIVN